MDGERFDRLSVVVHRLGERATRRGVLGLVLGGSLTAADSLLAQNVGAHKQNKRHKKNNKNNKNWNCRGYGGQCWSNKDCCNSNCRSGRCWYGGSGSGQHCGGQNCQNGWGCCSQGGVSVCVPSNFPTCCGNHGFANGYTCCGGSGGACIGGLNACTGQFGICCQPGWKHCSNSFTSTCIPNNWDCDQFFFQSTPSAGLVAESEQIPSTDPVPVPPEDWIELPQA
jgi:hypothetical protein